MVTYLDRKSDASGYPVLDSKLELVRASWPNRNSTWHLVTTHFRPGTYAHKPGSVRFVGLKVGKRASVSRRRSTMLMAAFFLVDQATVAVSRRRRVELADAAKARRSAISARASTQFYETW